MFAYAILRQKDPKMCAPAFLRKKTKLTMSKTQSFTHTHFHIFWSTEQCTVYTVHTVIIFINLVFRFSLWGDVLFSGDKYQPQHSKLEIDR